MVIGGDVMVRGHKDGCNCPSCKRSRFSKGTAKNGKQAKQGSFGRELFGGSAKPGFGIGRGGIRY